MFRGVECAKKEKGKEKEKVLGNTVEERRGYFGEMEMLVDG